MKRKIILISVVVIVLALISARLVITKQGRDAELKSISRISPVIPVLVDTVKWQNISTGFRTDGVFEAGSEVTIASETQGSVTSVIVKAGDAVRANQVLARINNEVILSKLELAKAAFEKSEKDFDRFGQLSREDAASIQQFEAARLEFVNAKANLSSVQKEYDNSVIKSPSAGTIIKRYLEKGSYLSPGSPAFEIVNTSITKFIMTLSAGEMEGIKEGEMIEITADALPGSHFTGKISSVIIKADDSKRYRVEAEVNNTGGKIKPGMFGNAVFSGSILNQSLVIPRKALNGSIKDPDVFVVEGGLAMNRKISAVPVNDKYVAVFSGLKAGECVVVSGQINLKNGSKIKVNK